MRDLIQEVILDGKKMPSFSPFRSGDMVVVSVRVREGDKERLQAFKGRVVKIVGSGVSRSFTVRKISDGVGVERTFPYMSPAVAGVEVVSKGKVRRSRLFYLRNLRGKAASIRSEILQGESEANSEGSKSPSSEG